MKAEVGGLNRPSFGMLGNSVSDRVVNLDFFLSTRVLPNLRNNL